MLAGVLGLTEAMKPASGARRSAVRSIRSLLPITIFASPSKFAIAQSMVEEAADPLVAAADAADQRKVLGRDRASSASGGADQASQSGTSR